MLVSIRHRLVILAMPKCASTALETALAGRMDMVMRGHPGVKHTPFRKYDRFLRPYLETYTNAPLEVVCLFREPVDWLHSWWRYRGRDGVPDPANSTRGMSFEDFVEACLDGQHKPADVGRPSRFVADKAGAIGPDRLFRHDDMATFTAYLEARLETRITLEHENVSPRATEPARLGPTLRARAERELAREFEIYRSLA